MAAERQKPRLWRRWTIIVAVVVALGYWWWSSGAAATPTYHFETAKITRGDVTELVTATGTLAPVTKVTVGSEVSGDILKIFVDYNSRVSRGQVLAQIDPSTIQAQIDQNQAAVINAISTFNQQVAHQADAVAAASAATAAIETARANVQTAIATQEGGRAAWIGAKAQVAKSRADYDNLKKTFQRDDDLFKKDLIARSELDTAESADLQAKAALDAQLAQLAVADATWRSNQATVNAARGNLAAAILKQKSAEAQLAQAKAQVAAAQALVRQARATLESSRVLLSKTTIRSPVTGVVLERKVSVGQTVQASYAAPELFVLAENLDAMRLEANIDEADVGRVKEHAHVTFTVDAYPDETFEGDVTQLRQSPQPAPTGSSASNVVTYTAVVETQNIGHKLRPGMTATVRIRVAQRKDVLLVPNAALRFKPPDDVVVKTPGAPSPSASATASPVPGKTSTHEQTLWTVSPSNPQKLVQTTVTVGITDGNNTELLVSSLHKGDSVVVSAEVDATSKTKLPLLR